MAGGTRATLQVVDHLSSDLDYPQFNIESVEASTPETTTGTNATASNAISVTACLPQTSSIRSYLSPIFGIGVDYPSSWSAFEIITDCKSLSQI